MKIYPPYNSNKIDGTPKSGNVGPCSQFGEFIGKMALYDFLWPPAALTPKVRGLKFLHIVSTIDRRLLHTRPRTCVKIDFIFKFQNILLVEVKYLVSGGGV